MERRRRLGKDYTLEELEAIPRDELTNEQRKDLKNLRRLRTLRENRARAAAAVNVRRGRRARDEEGEEGNDEEEAQLEDRRRINRREAARRRNERENSDEEPSNSSAENLEEEDLRGENEEPEPSDSSSSSSNHDSRRSSESRSSESRSESEDESFDPRDYEDYLRNRREQRRRNGNPLVDRKQALKTARSVIKEFNGNPEHTLTWTHMFRQLTQGLSAHTKQLLFYEKIDMEVRKQFNGIFRDLTARPVEEYLRWLENAFYTANSELVHHERLDELQWDALNVNFSTFLREFELASSHVLQLSDVNRKRILWQKLPQSLRDGLQVFYPNVDYYGLVKIIADNENLKKPRIVNNVNNINVVNNAQPSVNSVGTTVVPHVEFNDVNAIDRARERDTRTDRHYGQRKFYNNNRECRYCGRRNHRSEDCLDHITCYNCGKKGHKQNDCYSRKRQRTDNYHERRNGDRRDRYDDDDRHDRRRKEPQRR